MFQKLREKIFGARASNEVAKSRLHFVLVQDRTGLTNEELAGFKEQMIGVIENFFVIDKQGFDISYRRNGETTTLYINSPIIVRRQDAIKGDVGARHQSKNQKKRFERNRLREEAAAAAAAPVEEAQPQVANAEPIKS